MNSEELRLRTRKYAGEVIRFVDNLPKGMAYDVIGRQLMRSATSVAANYRTTCRARSRPDFVNKLGIVEEEADETLFWFEMLVESGKCEQSTVSYLIEEAKEIVAIFSASHRTARINKYPSH
jgi:four helix bundle protein